MNAVTKKHNVRTSASSPYLLRNAFDFFVEHYGAISACLVASGIICSVLFLIGYLAGFDQQLIWLVESADILKIALVAVSFSLLLVTSAILIAIPHAIEWGRSGIWKWPILAIPALVLLGFLFEASSALFFGQGWHELSMLVWLMFLSAYGIIFILVRLIVTRARVDFYIAIFVLLLIGALSVLAGMSYGVSTRSNSSQYNVFLSESFGEQRSINGARLVMFTSRFAVFYADRKTIIVPADAVVRIEAWR